MATKEQLKEAVQDRLNKLQAVQTELSPAIIFVREVLEELEKDRFTVTATQLQNAVTKGQVLISGVKAKANEL